MEGKFNEFRESDRSLSMPWAQLKDPLCYMGLSGSVVQSWSLVQKVADSNNLFYKYFVTAFSEF